MTSRGPSLTLTVLGLLAANPGLAAPNAPPGAASCSGCHSPTPGVGAALGGLAGLGADGIAAGMAHYRADEGSAHVMSRIARGFSEAESRAIAEWIAAGPRP